jgi:phosphoribosylanthranilate isomerase
LKVKICGIKSLEAARNAVECGADALGFVFADSKRKITVEAAKNIINEIPEKIWKVGVFVNEKPHSIKETAMKAGLTHIQLHGDEDPALYKELSLPIIKSIPASSTETIQNIHSIKAEYVLLDSPPNQYRGGNGTSFDWDKAEGIGKSNAKIILAGGLSPDNVQLAIRKIQPYMVDVSSGVETNGEKDPKKIRDFIVNAKRAEEEDGK